MKGRGQDHTWSRGVSFLFLGGQLTGSSRQSLVRPEGQIDPLWSVLPTASVPLWK